MATTRAKHLKLLKMCLFLVSLSFFSLLSPLCSGTSCSHHSPEPPFTSPMWSLFEKALVEEMGVAGESLVLQAEEQVPEIDTCDPLPHGPGARRPGAAGERQTRPWSLPVPDQQEEEGETGQERGEAFAFKNIAHSRYNRICRLKIWLSSGVINRIWCSSWAKSVLPPQTKRMENPETSSSSWGRWQPEPSGWPPFVSAEPAPAAASKKRKHRYQHEPKQTACEQDNYPSSSTSFAFCFSRSCSGSSCRDLDCKAKKDFEVRRKTRSQAAWSNTEEMTRDKHSPCVNIQPTTTALKASKTPNQTLVLTKQRLHSAPVFIL